MRIALFSLHLLLVVFLDLSVSHASSILAPSSYGDMVATSDIVVLARAENADGYARGKMIFTRTSFTVLDVVKGGLQSGRRIDVETMGGNAGTYGMKVAGSPDFEDGEVYLLSLRRRGDVWAPMFLSYGLLREAVMPTGQVVLAHLETAHDLDVVQKVGRAVEPITVYRKKELLGHLKEVARGASWNKSEAGELALPLRQAFHAAKLADIGIKPYYCSLITHDDGLGVRWDRFEKSEPVTVFASDRGSSFEQGLVNTAVEQWKALPGIDIGTLAYGGGHPQPACSDTSAVNALFEGAIGEGEVFVFFDDPCNEIPSLQDCQGILAFASVLWSTQDVHGHRDQDWHPLLKAGIVVNEHIVNCLGEEGVQMMVTHEVGHTLGFGHTFGVSANMKPQCCAPVGEADLTCAQFLYNSTSTFNPPPIITSVSEMTLQRGEEYTLQIQGERFMPGSTAFFDEHRLEKPVFVKAVRVLDEANIEADILVNVNLVLPSTRLQVGNPPPGGGGSNAVWLTIDTSLPKPVVASITPNTIYAGTVDTLIFKGEHFYPHSKVLETSLSAQGVVILSSTVFDRQTIQVVVATSKENQTGSRQIRFMVQTQDQSSDPVPVTVVTKPNPVPELLSVHPHVIPTGTSTLVTVKGRNFHPLSRTWIEDLDGTTSIIRGIGQNSLHVVDSTTITFQALPYGDAYGEWRVFINTPAPGGGASNKLPITVSLLGTSFGEPDDLPTEFELMPNYPNPFNPVTTIPFSLPAATSISLDVYDLTGRRVRSLYAGEKGAGRHEVQFDGSDVGSGLYFVVLKSAFGSKTRSLMLLK